MQNEKASENSPVRTPSNDLDTRVAVLRGATRGKSRWSDRIAYTVGGQEFIHFHGPEEVDIRLTARLQSLHKARLTADSRVTFRRNRSEWITFSLRSADDIDEALEWIRLARDANRG